MGEQCDQARRNALASDLAQARFCSSPLLRNELLNRVKPSSSAVAARNALLRRMALHEGEERLGIEGFLAEGGLFASILDDSRLYRNVDDEWRFAARARPATILATLRRQWDAAAEFLESNRQRTVPPCRDLRNLEETALRRQGRPAAGLGRGPFILSQRRALAFYRQSIFQSQITDLDMEYLAHDARTVQLRWMDLSDEARALLSDMAGIVRELDPANALPDLEPIDVARGLVSIYDRLPPWAGRTQGLSANAKQVRQLCSNRRMIPTASSLMTFPSAFQAPPHRAAAMPCAALPTTCAQA